jgi:hypothetical protein
MEQEIESGEALRGQASKAACPLLIFLLLSAFSAGGMARGGSRRRNGVPIETLPGRKAETDCKGISEGFRLAKSERAVPGGVGAKGYATPPSGLSASSHRQIRPRHGPTRLSTFVGE